MVMLSRLRVDDNAVRHSIREGVPGIHELGALRLGAASFEGWARRRSFVAKGAPLDDGQGRMFGKT
jgi:hypothetical protein